jgi:hypothetical protein
MTDLEEAIYPAREAVKATPLDHPDRAGCLNSLGIRLSDRYSRTGAMTDLEEAISMTQEAVKATSLDYSGRAGCLNNLGNRLGDRFSRTGAMTDLEEAIHVTQEAVKATPLNHPNQARYLNNLGNWLSTRYERTGSIDDLNHAIEVMDIALDATPQGHPDRATMLSNLRDRLRTRFERTRSIDEDMRNSFEAQLLTRHFLDDNRESNQTTTSISSNSPLKDSEPDSGYVSASRPATLVAFSESAFAGRLDGMGYSFDGDIQSFASDDDDIGSQASNETTNEERTGQALIRVFLAEDSQFRPLCEKAMAQMDEQRFVENLRRLLKSFYKNLSAEAEGKAEMAVARLLRSRSGRGRISQQLVAHIQQEQEEVYDGDRVDLQIAADHKQLVETWLTRASEGPGVTWFPEKEFGNHDIDIQLSTSDSDSDSLGDEFPNISLQILLKDFMLMFLPTELRHVLSSIPKEHVWASQEQDLSVANRVKAWVEDSTQVSWNWWPLKSRKRMLRDGESRIFWKCVSPNLLKCRYVA